MATEAEERRAVVRAQQMGASLPPMEHQDPLPCPRCTSTNTKFCYYNNYNFSQPRHFCKSCRRYWTHGGTLRDIPVGGGTRKTAKRSRTSSSSSHSSVPSSVTATSTSSVGPMLEPIPLNQAHSLTHTHAPVYVSGATPVGGGFTSLLSGGSGGVCNGGLLALGGFSLGIGLDEYGLGVGRGVWAFPNHEVGSSYVDNSNNSGGDVNGSNNNSSGSNDGVGLGAVSGEEGGGNSGGGVSRNDTWQVEGGEVVGFVGAAADCFASLPELAMSSSPNFLK